MKTNRHNKTTQRSASSDGLSHHGIEDRTGAETLLAGENRILEMLATGYGLSDILDALCRLIEDIASGSLCGIVLVDPISNRLQHGAAPSLPLSYNESIHGRPVNLFSGPCAMAAFLKETSDCRRCRVGHTMGYIRMARSGHGAWTEGMLVHANLVIR